MSRKKISKNKAKKTIKKPKNQIKAISSILSMEKELKSIPAKLTAQLSKEAAKLKKQESRIQTSLKKLENQKRVANNKQNSLTLKAQNARSGTAKKQLVAINKIIQKLEKNITQLVSELSHTQNQLSLTTEKQYQILSISKEIAQLDKKSKIKSTQVATKSSKKASSQIEPLQPKAENLNELLDSSFQPAEEIVS